jgi:hypothetical protein
MLRLPYPSRSIAHLITPIRHPLSVSTPWCCRPRLAAEGGEAGGR